MPNTRKNPDVLQPRLDNPDRLLSARNRESTLLPTPSPSVATSTEVTQPPRLFRNLAGSLTTQPLKPGERILTASKSVAELFNLNPVPLNSLSPGTSSILTDILDRTTTDRCRSFVPGSLPDTTGISIDAAGGMTTNESPTPSGNAPPPEDTHLSEEDITSLTERQGNELDAALRQVREESADAFARMAAENDDLRAEIGGIRALLEEMVVRQRTIPSTIDAVPIATSTPPPASAAGILPPHPDSTVRHQPAEETPASSTDHELSGNQPPFATFRSPGGPTRAPVYWAYPMMPPKREVLAKHMKDSEIPQFTCAYGDVAGFRLWKYRIEAKFKVKGLMNDAERLKVLPAALAIPHAVQWHRTHEAELEGKSWGEAMEMFENGVLPSGWMRDAKQALRELSMQPGEDMQAYLVRARSLQDTVTMAVCSDHELAEKIVGGTSALFRESAAKDDLIDSSVDPRTGAWSFSLFEEKVLDTARFLRAFDISHSRSVARQSPTTTRPSQSLSTAPSGNTYTSRAPVDPQAQTERWAAFMRSTGRCPRCKTQCAKWLGGCDAPANMSYIPFPPDFPRRAPYPPPNPAANTSTAAATPAARPGAPRRGPVIPIASVQVNQVSQSPNEFPDLGKADIAAYGDLVAALGIRDDGSRDKSNVESTSEQTEAGAA